jgi:hypothetical protein
MLTLPVLLTVMMSFACMLGLQLSLKWSRTIVAVMASVGVLAGLSAVLGVCGFAAAASLSWFGLLVSAFSPFTAICVLIDPAYFAKSSFGPGGTFDELAPSGLSAPLVVGRVIVVIAVLIASASYCGLVWGMYRSMVRNFDMIIRRQHQ